MATARNMVGQTLANFINLINNLHITADMGDQKSQLALMSFYWRWQQLELISQRISDEAKQPAKVIETNLLALDIETFIIVVRSLMDDIAAFTPHFYPAGPKPNRHSFNEQFKWYINPKHTDFDQPMTEYLAKNLGWFAELKDMRDGLLHRHDFLLALLPEKKRGEVQVSSYNLDLKLSDFMTKLRATLRNLLIFVDFYSEHFKKRLKQDCPTYIEIPTEADFWGYKQLNQWLHKTPK